jgi:hypothetical protein
MAGFGARRDARIETLTPGTLIPGYYPWLPDQVVLMNDISYDRGTELRTITTTGGFINGSPASWTLPTGSRLYMPMRQDRSIIDWRTREAPPLVAELAHGDRLITANENPDDYQIVVRLQGASGRNEFSCGIVTVDHLAKKEHKWRVEDYRQAFLPPYTEDPVARSRAKSPGEIFFGPYLYNDTEFWFAVHPTGRGKWPVSIPAFNSRPEVPIFRCRPPGPSFPWFDLEFTGQERHPKDPMAPSRTSLDLIESTSTDRQGGRNEDPR